MSWFKRPEVWVMLVLVVAGAGYVAFTGNGNGNGRGGVGSGAGLTEPAAGASATASRLKVRRLGLTRDFGNARLEIEIDYDNRGAAEVLLSPPDVVLETGDGEPVDPFFLAGDFPDPIAAGERDRATLQYWLQPDHFAGALVLKVRGEVAPVKPGRPFDLESVANQETVELELDNWTP